MQLFGCAPEIHNSVFIKKVKKAKKQKVKNTNVQNSILSKKVKK